MFNRLKKLSVFTSLLLLFAATAIAASPQVYNIETQNFDTIRKERVRVNVSLVNGQSFEGYLKSYDEKMIIFEALVGDILVYKHAVASVTIETTP